MTDQPKATTLETIQAALDNLHGRVTTLEQQPAGNPASHGRVLKHLYDWAQKFGMPALPAPKAEPSPPPPPPPAPEGFTG